MPSGEHRNATLIAVRISSGQLSRWHPCRVKAGEGSGQTCACCEKPIVLSDVQYDAEMDDGRTLSMHLLCYGAWRDATLRMAVPPYSGEIQQPPWNKQLSVGSVK